MRALKARSFSRAGACALAFVFLALSAHAALAPRAVPFDEVRVVTSDLGDFEWYPGAQMSVPRAYPETIVLGDGDIMVIGGLSGTWPTSTTEIYDLSTGQWSPGPQMMHPRVGHSATLLEDGTVLVTGGETGDGTTSSAELLDPWAGSSAAVGNMYFSRSGHEAALLPSGMVLVTGGTDWISAPRKEAEIYDPSTHRFSPAGSMSAGRVFFSLMVTYEGRALAVGGNSAGTSEEYDPVENEWSDVAPMTSSRYNAASAMLPDGRVMVAGGIADSVTLSSTETYDPESRAWSTGPAMGIPRANFGFVALPDGALLATGSYSSAGIERTTEVLPAGAEEWEYGPSMAIGRGAHAFAALENGTAFVAGGITAAGVTASCELMMSDGDGTPDMCLPEDIVPLIEMIAEELQGHSERGFVAQLLAAQAEYDAGDIEECLEIMNAFYYHVRGFLYSEHMSPEHADMLYEAYADVVECLGGEPKPEYEVPGARERPGRPV